MKKCSSCKVNKELSAFYPRKEKPLSPYRSECKECGNKSRKQWRKANPEAFKSSWKNWELKNPKGRFNSYLLREYGITLEQRSALALKQNMACAICKIPEIELPRLLDVDHNHITGKVRGLLCGS